MTFTRHDMTLFFSLALDGLDTSNLERSGVSRVMVPFGMADGRLCEYMASKGKRLILRLTEDDYYRDGAAQAIRGALLAKKALCPVDAVIIGVEPDWAPTQYDFTYPSKDWGQQHAWEHARYAGRVISACKDTGVPLYSAGWSQRGISEDEPPQPGQIAWREILEPTYQLCQGACAHIYGYSWRSDVDRQRAKWALRRAQELFHYGPVFVDEFAVFAAGSQTERMGAFIDFCRIIEGHQLGQRVSGAALFVSNGDGKAYSPDFIIRDPAAYDMLGGFMREKAAG